MTDTRLEHSEHLECYCEQCCDTAADWYEWQDPSGQNASGSRYWTREHALADQNKAIANGLTVLIQQGPPDGKPDMGGE